MKNNPSALTLLATLILSTCAHIPDKTEQTDDTKLKGRETNVATISDKKNPESEPLTAKEQIEAAKKEILKILGDKKEGIQPSEDEDQVDIVGCYANSIESWTNFHSTLGGAMGKAGDELWKLREARVAGDLGRCGEEKAYYEKCITIGNQRFRIGCYLLRAPRRK